jgi:hypothetical protein
VSGSIHAAPDASTAQREVDFQTLYTYISALPYGIPLLYPAQFGNSLVLTPHTYFMNAAAVLTDSLYLNAEGNANAIFVIQINGALTTSTYAVVSLINGAQAKNVYWEVQGAVTINNYSIFCGNIVGNGAIILGTGNVLNGRALTMTGNINTTAVIANNAFGGTCAILPIELLSFTGFCDVQNVDLAWSTAAETGNRLFTIQRSCDDKNWRAIGIVDGVGNSSTLHSYVFTDNPPGRSIYYYRLMLADFNGNNTYSINVVVEKCGIDSAFGVAIYPNPSTGKFSLFYAGNTIQVSSIEIFNTAGAQVFQSIGFQSTFNLSNKPSGEYFVHIHLPSKTVNLEVLVIK